MRAAVLRMLSELASKLAADGEPIVVAAGGDGTLNAVVQGLTGTGTALGVLPAGTMNVFARELGLPHGSLKKSLEVLQAGFIKEVDLFEANGRPFMQMAGIGFDAQVIEETTWEQKKILGPMAYIMTAMKVLGDKPPKMRIICDDGHVGRRVLCACGQWLTLRWPGETLPKSGPR